MASRRRGTTEAQFDKWVKEGRGSGQHAGYKPWLKVNDLPSQGRVHRIYGYKSRRTHHLLSDLELAVFLMLEWHPSVTQIREQFPLQRTLTRKLAKQAGIKHPCIAGVDQYMSSDFLVNSVEPDRPKFVLQAKYKEALEDPHTVEKLELERRYWRSKSLPWFLVTEKEVPQAVLRNIQWLYPAQHRSESDVELDLQQIQFYAHHLEANPDKTLVAVCKKLDVAYDLSPGDSLFEMRQLLAKRYFKFDIGVPNTKLKAKDLQPGDLSHIREAYLVSNQ
ncbi:TnsA endonuclease C-terminal domain-containing protein [Ferrimonas pelagia]|uniref:TnsA endonuclease N-terminal domain-containing protein n=1 Tax=Ferrimonas pelagia TaxID=1177826 RepID=A0ABP9F8J5_9GAMM